MAEPIYHALRVRTRWLKYLLYGWTGFSLLEAVPRLALLLQAEGVSINPTLAESGEFAELVLGLSGIFLLAGIVAFCFWIYRANANLHAFGIGDIHSSGWAVGVYFIPVVSLWMGYQVMREVWDKSGPPDSDLDGKGWLLPVWWAGWVGTNILSTLTGRGSRLLDPTTLAAMNFAEPVAHLVAGAALIAIISLIDVAQHQQQSLEVF